MYELTIPAMTCDHCKRAITKAALTLDPDTTLHFDLAAHKVKVQTMGPLAALKAALAAIDYPVAEVVEQVTEVKEQVAEAKREAARCCGHCKA